MSVQRRGSRPSSATSRSSVNESDIRIECRAVFLSKYDDIRDEIESKEDLVQLLQQTGRNASRKIISKYWTKDTESLAFDDFVDICKKEHVTSEDELRKAFQKIDINGDGYISLEELFKVMTTKGEKLSRAEVKAIIDEVDENKDGKLDYKEFSHMVVSSAEDFKKMSIKMMEKKERRKMKKRDGDITPRRESVRRPSAASHHSVNVDQQEESRRRPSAASSHHSVVLDQSKEPGRRPSAASSRHSVVPDQPEESPRRASVASHRSVKADEAKESPRRLSVASHRSVKADEEKESSRRASVASSHRTVTAEEAKDSPRRLSVASHRSVTADEPKDSPRRLSVASHRSVTADEPKESSRRASVASSHKTVTADEPKESSRRASVASSHKTVTADEPKDSPRRLSVVSHRSVTADEPKESSRRASVASSHKTVTADEPKESPRRASVASSHKTVTADEPEESPKRRPSAASSHHSVVPDQPEESRRRPSAASSHHSVTAEKPEASRRASRQSLMTEAYDETSQSRRGSRPRSAGQSARYEPTNLREWSTIHSKGTFFVEDTGIISHTYKLELSEDTDVFISIEPLKIGESGESLDGTVIDTALLILGSDDSFVAFTEQKDSKGKYSIRCSLSMGSYQLVPFTTGCRLKARHELSTKEAKLIGKDKEGKVVLSRGFKRALEEIFEMADLDGNGLLSRDEFDWYNQRTSGDFVADDEWQVVEDNIELEKGEITRTGFIRLNEMEAEDNEGDTEDLWVTLTNMGFNKALILDEACPFLLKVHAQDCRDPELKVTGMHNNIVKINEALCEFVTSKTDGSPVKGMKDLTLYTFQNNHRAIVVVDNKSKTRVKMELDCSHNKGLVSHTGSLVTTVSVPPQTAVVGHHILPLDDRGDFNVVCEETILK